MANQENKYKFGQRKLNDIIKKRMTTTIIGIIASFEQVFDKSFPENYDKATKEELDFQDKFEEFRESALDKGNRQLRELLRDIEQFNIDYVGYQLELRKKDGENE
jgi:hypothetical protein